MKQVESGYLEGTILKDLMTMLAVKNAAGWRSAGITAYPFGHPSHPKQNCTMFLILLEREIPDENQEAE